MSILSNPTLLYCSTHVECSVLGRHTGDNISIVIQRCLHQYNIDKKIRFIITDNAANMKKAFSVLLAPADQEESNHLQPTELDDSSLWQDVDEVEQEVEAVSEGKTRLSCLAHTLQLAIGDGLKV